MQTGFRSLLVLGVLLLGACASLRPSSLPKEPAYIVAVKSVRIPDTEPLVARLAKHTFFDAKGGSEKKWRRFEVFNRNSGVVAEDLGWWEPRQDIRWHRPVEVLAVFTGEKAKRIFAGLEKEARLYPADGVYSAWPGPNSNTFAAWLARRIPELKFEFDHNAVGKDFTAGFAVRRTPSGTGFQVDTTLLGFSLAAVEGIEIHLLGLTFGVSFLHPAIEIPGLPRLGFPIR